MLFAMVCIGGKMNKQSGFTLLEVMVVIAVIALLVAVAIPNFVRYRNARQVALSARNVYTALQLAKITAIKDNTAVNVQFTTGIGDAGKYQVFVDANDDDTFNAGDTDIQSGGMEPGVNMASASFAGLGDSMRFTSVGMTPGANGTVTVTNGHLTNRIVVNIVGGIRME